jgi:hypothetical protein
MKYSLIMILFNVRINKVLEMSAVPILALELWFRVVSHCFFKSMIAVFIVNSIQIPINDVLLCVQMRAAGHNIRQRVFLKKHFVHPFAEIMVDKNF